MYLYTIRTNIGYGNLQIYRQIHINIGCGNSKIYKPNTHKHWLWQLIDIYRKNTPKHRMYELVDAQREKYTQQLNVGSRRYVDG